MASLELSLSSIVPGADAYLPSEGNQEVHSHSAVAQPQACPAHGSGLRRDNNRRQKREMKQQKVSEGASCSICLESGLSIYFGIVT